MGRESLEEASRDELIDRVLASHARLEELEQQLRWFKQQLFGARSERRVPAADPAQLSLGEGLARPSEAAEAGRPVRAHVRRPRRKQDALEEDPGLRFDNTVPVQRIVVEDPALEGLVEGVDYTVIST